MVIFIAAVNLFSIGKGPEKYSRDKKSISSMTFRDMGVTEEKVKSFFESKTPKAIFFKYSMLAGFLIMMAGAAMNLVFLFGKKKIIPDKLPEKKYVPWGIPDVARVVIIVFFSGYFLSALAAVILKPFHLNIDINLQMILGTFIIDTLAGVTILYFALVKYKGSLSSIGITFRDFYRNVLSGITAYVFILPILAAALMLSIIILDAIGYKFPPQPVFDMFFEEKRGGIIVFLTIFVSVLGPVMEEMFFRGFLYSAVKKRFGLVAGVLASGALFSILHVNIAGFLPILILGVLMAFLYEATGSLVASITVHIAHNSIIVGFVFFIKELLK
jgi:hypothetical protein